MRNFINNRQGKALVERDMAALCIRRIHGTGDNCLPAYSDLHDDNSLLELLKAYFHIGNLRNQVCHAEAPQTAGAHASTAARLSPSNS